MRHWEALNADGLFKVERHFIGSWSDRQHRYVVTRKPPRSSEIETLAIGSTPEEALAAFVASGDAVRWHLPDVLHNWRQVG